MINPWLKLRIQSTDEVFLTFDDGPDPESTPILLDLLNENQVMATFFLLGSAAEAHPEIVQEIISHGHAVHLHGWTHQPARKLSNKVWLQQIARAGQVIQGNIYRPPFGRISLTKILLAKRNKIPVMLWNVDPRDYRMGEPDLVSLTRLTDKIVPGDIILLHDKCKSAKKTLTYTSHIISKIKGKGHRLSTIS